MSKQGLTIDTAALPQGRPIFNAVDRSRHVVSGRKTEKTLTQAVREASQARDEGREFACDARDSAVSARAAGVRAVVWCAVLAGVQAVCLVVWFFLVSRV